MLLGWLCSYWVADGSPFRGEWDTLLLFLTLLATAYAARGAARSARAAERALVDLERPQVVVDIKSSGLLACAGEIGLDREFRYVFVNYGRTVAYLTKVSLHYPIVPLSEMPAPLTPDDEHYMRGLPTGVVSAPGAPYEETENLFVAYGPVLMKEKSIRKHRLFFMGWVRYKDLFGASYVTGFCFVFDPIRGRFVRIGDKPYNYFRQEHGPGR